jgi:hypothetical protein
MESFLSRKRRRLSPSPQSSLDEELPASLITPLDEEPMDTDLKLAILSSLFPLLDQPALLDILLAHDGSVEAATATLKAQDPSTPTVISRTPGYQSSLSDFTSGAEPTKKHRLLSRKGKTLFLYSPEDVAAHTPCSIIHNFLPQEDANALLNELMLEAPSFEKTTFKLFDNVVTSPHTSCFYVPNVEEIERHRTEYVYNGARLTNIRQITSAMTRVSAQVQAAVNIEVEKRIKSHYPDGKKLKYQSPHPWTPNAAFANCYDGAQESVGYHSDQLTYLGPRAIIGSISLGVAREFRVRRIVPQDVDSSAAKSKDDEDAQGQISIHLPHNSLLVMHAEMQEEWKHSIAPAQAIDPHPIAGNKRFNITYRDYKASLHPRFTPKCKCGIPGVLRVVQRKKENHGRYFWMCHAGNVPGKEGCTFFLWAEFTDDGEPIWKSGTRGDQAK